MSNSNNNPTTMFAIAAIILLLLLLSFSSPPLTTMAQQQQQMTTITGEGAAATSLIPPLTPVPPLTPEEQEEQTRLQNVIAATNQNLDEAEKQVNGIVYTPRWSNPVWVEPEALSILLAYCLPGEFAESGQEILGGFELEVLESYEIALPQGFMAWMAVVGNEDGNVRLPAALGVICASDLNRADTRILSPQEQQEINNINQQFSTIQNTQVTNIDQVINVINNVTEPTTGQPLTVEASANVTEAFAPVWVMFDAKVTGGTPPYSYSWEGFASEIREKSFTQLFDQPDPFIFVVNVTDSMGQTASDSIQIVINRPPTNDTGGGTTEEQPFRAEIVTNATEIGRTTQPSGNTWLEVWAYTGSTIKFDAKITGGTPPYSYSWYDLTMSKWIDYDKSITLGFYEPGTFNYILRAEDSSGKRWGDRVHVTIEERPGVLPPTETGGEGQPPGALFSPGTVPPSNDTGEAVPPPEGEEEQSPSPSDDTGVEGEEEETPPSSTTEEEELPSPPGGDTGEGG